MSESIQQVLQWISLHPHWAGLATFLMAFAESLAVVGMVVPGVAVMFALGTLIGAGALDFSSMVAWAVAGAVAGDGLSFWLGWKYRQQLSALWPFNKHPRMLEKGIAFFQKYGGKSVAIGRFFGPVRAIIPLVAGMMQMPKGRFFIANLLSALVWAPAYLLPGVVFGASLELASEVAMRLAVLLIVLVALLWFLGWSAHRIFLLLQPHAKSLLQRLLELGDRMGSLQRIARALADPNHPEAAGLAMFAGLLLLAVFGLTLLALFPHQPLALANDALHLAMKSLANPGGDRIMLQLAALAGNGFSLALLFSLWILLVAFGLRQAAKHWLIGSGSIWGLAAFLEYFLRQNPQWIDRLPDIYVLRAVVLFTLATVIIASPLPTARRWLPYALATLLVGAVALAQLYLGSTLHSVLIALAGGLAWSAALGVAYRTHARTESIRPHHAGLLGSLSISAMVMTMFISPSPLPRPDILTIHAEMNQTHWLDQGWQRLPLYRDDLRHAQTRPLNVQIAVPIRKFIHHLETQGWRLADTASGLNWLRMLTSGSGMEKLPVVPHSHENRLQSRVLVKYLPQKRLALYLWPSHYLNTHNAQPFWLGELVEQQAKQGLGVFEYPISLTNPKALETLHDDLKNSDMKLVFVERGKRLLVATIQD